MIPCKNCITFAICNGQISDDTPFSDVVNKLIPKCSLIQEYTKCPNSVYDYPAKVDQVVEFFKPKKHLNCIN